MIAWNSKQILITKGLKLVRLPLWDLFKASSVEDWGVEDSSLESRLLISNSAHSFAKCWLGISSYDEQTAVQGHTRLRKLDLYLILKMFVLYPHFIYFYVQYKNWTSQRNYTKLRSRALWNMWRGKVLRMRYQIRVVNGAQLK